MFRDSVHAKEDTTLAQEEAMRKHLEMRNRMFDVIMYDLLIGATEDVPQLFLVWATNNILDDITYISLLTFATSITLILWKGLRVILNKSGLMDDTSAPSS